MTLVARREQLQKLKEALTTLSAFKKNWNGYDAEPANKRASILANYLLDQLSELGLAYPSKITIEYGEIVLTWNDPLKDNILEVVSGENRLTAYLMVELGLITDLEVTMFKEEDSLPASIISMIEVFPVS